MLQNDKHKVKCRDCGQIFMLPNRIDYYGRVYSKRNQKVLYYLCPNCWMRGRIIKFPRRVANIFYGAVVGALLSLIIIFIILPIISAVFDFFLSFTMREIQGAVTPREKSRIGFFAAVFAIITALCKIGYTNNVISFILIGICTLLGAVVGFNLLKDIEEHPDREQAIRDLGEMGIGSLPILIEAMNDLDMTIRELAAHYIGKIGPIKIRDTSHIS